MSLESRSNSALFKRAEQLKRWEQSETNRELSQPMQVTRKIKFSTDCVFLAACAAGDKEEVIRLLQKGADINTGNVDGLTALHQACIDDDLDMVEFLVEQGADINRGDNEGWTPLHATASCGFISIAKYLIEQGCNLAAVNNDGELALDITGSDMMEEMLHEHFTNAGIDCEEARSEEERLMLNDARAWRSGAPGKDAMHPRTGATALHVAAAKGYSTVMNLLLQARCDVNAKDHDGWTPLHGAAHWGQVEACKLLVENFCDMDIKNYAGQTAFDIADPDIVKALEELKQKQEILLKDHSQINKQPAIPKKRATNKENLINDQKAEEKYEEETPNKVKKVELEIQSDNKLGIGTNSDVEKENRVNCEETTLHSLQIPPDTYKVTIQAPMAPPKQQSENNEDGTVPSWRRSGSFKNRSQENAEETEDHEKHVIKMPTSPIKVSENQEVDLRSHSLETDEEKKDLKLNLELSRVPQGNSTQLLIISNKTLPTSPASVMNPNPSVTISPLPVIKIRRSFVLPVRDEESETQRKAHAKRVRETRRSTQGVTLDEIKSAEQLVKKKQQQSNDVVMLSVATATTTTTTLTTSSPHNQFQLEDANSRSIMGDTTAAFIRRPSSSTNSPRPSSAPIDNITGGTAEMTVTLPLRRTLKPPEDKEQDKENDSRNAQATQAVIQRRRRPKRRSTGVVHVDMDEIYPEKQDVSTSGDCDDNKTNHSESEHERSGRSSRLSSVSSLNSETGSASPVPSRTKCSVVNLTKSSENSEINYKKLYEESQSENERLRDKLRKSDAELKETQGLLEKSQQVYLGKPMVLSETEKRERRAMERKLSEMEEELKMMETLKCENQRLKDENGALIRVISKLSK